MATYRTVTTLGDFGPWVSKLLLDLPCEVRADEVSPATFNVFCTRRETKDGSVLMRSEKGAARETPSQGYAPVLRAYPCDEGGSEVPTSSRVALEMGEIRVNKRIEGGVTRSRFVRNDYRVTQVADVCRDDGPVNGLVFDECAGDVCPALDGWHESVQSKAVDGIRLEYGYYEPSFEPFRPNAFSDLVTPPERAALIVWLHGAGEGAGGERGEVGRAYQGNRVTALSQRQIQSYFGGAAWVLVPQCPTFWMDDGESQLGRVNESIYVRALKELIDEFVAAHADRVDPGRIVIGGLSNGGFMTVRMCLDYPGFFSAGIAVCAPFYEENQTPEAVTALAKTPLWFVHSKGDELVDPTQTSLPLYRRLREAGAETHFTYFDHVEDLTGVYREPDGRPLRTFNHGVWTHVYNDFCRTDLDGTNVIVDGEPVGAWEWAADRRLG
ncbi:MAG TPA: prolyl oligopeptidase family serine peptidase [Candidatus Olsenella pullistercoris]|uniref:Prolyl oligopeptidase family serine peptidase n=1 Tax=Candidatus Olsenella pullistercoris TaxID=2838712 RepID=A0A9D2EXH1_9ACTN|nr:prolyl oligopeptidase family serine peptidase [Candidatus Olsenella pullistercoris]